MRDSLRTLTDLTKQLQRGPHLDLGMVLQRVVECAATVLSTPRASIRMFDLTRSRLIAFCRAGPPLHNDEPPEFRSGEGLVGWIASRGEPLLLAWAEADPRFSPRSNQAEPMGAFVGAPLVSVGECIGVLSAVHPQRGYFSEEHAALLGLLAGISAPYLEIARLHRLAEVDPLTGTLNRRGFDTTFPVEGAPERLSVALVDVDHFKEVNDTHGHLVGDQVLAGVASLLSGVLRSRDAVVRYGGEEFLLILPDVGLGQAVRIAERARNLVASEAVSGVHTTLSMGVATRRPEEARHELIQRADEALYRAKRAGRNRVEVAA